jgi:hypothetical protein
MKLIKAIKSIIAYHKTFKTAKIVKFTDDEVYDAYSFACSYRAQESVCKYYCSFYPNATFADAMELIRYSKALRDTITDVIKDRLLKVQMNEFDFTQDASDIRFFPEYDLDDRVTIAKLYEKDFGIKLIQLLSLRVEQAHYLYLKKEKGYHKEWKDYIDEMLRVDGFCDPAHDAMKFWIANLSFPSEVWSDKKVIGLMNEAKQRIETYGRQG